MRRGKEKSFAELQALAASGTFLFYQEKKVVIDPFSRLKFFIQVSWVSFDEAEFCPYWTLRDLQVPFSETPWIVEDAPSWCVHGGILRAFADEVPSYWISGTKTLKGKEIFQTLSFLKKEEVEVREINQEKGIVPPPLPFLVLTDRHGAFANLWFDYGALGSFPRHETTCSSFRDEEAERGWEKDLQETGFAKKQVGESHYYCPLDQVVKSLLFLLELGWKVLDKDKRRVSHQKQVDLKANLTQDGILLQGSVVYGKSQLTLSQVVGAFTRQERFIEITPSEVALIDRDSISSYGLNLEEEEIVDEGVLVKTARVGTLATLLSHDSVKLAGKERLLSLLNRKMEVPCLPGPAFQGTLFPYQVQGFQWLSFLSQGSLGGVLADEMGLGKTVQLLAFFSSLILTDPILIVTPTSLVFNWEREIGKFLPSWQVYRYEGNQRVKSAESLKEHQVILVSYALLRQDLAVFQTIEFQVIVLDEAQAIKNEESLISRAVSSLSARVRIAVTGTPVENRMEDLWSLFRFVQPEVLKEKKRFQEELLLAQASPLHLEKIRNKIRPFILRRTKKEVAIDLPEKIEQTILIEMSPEERSLYDQCLQKTRQGVLKQVESEGLAKHRMEVLEAILRLRQMCDHPLLTNSDFEGEGSKFERVFADLHEVVEEGSKVLVYSQFTQMLGILEKEVKKRGWGYVYLDGNTKNREEVVCRFQTDPKISIFLMSLKAGGVGLNLTKADYVFLYEPWWNEAVEAQAIDRAHRLGRTEPVIARRYITSLSIEEKMMSLKEHKKGLSQSLLQEEEGAMEAFSFEEILGMLD